MLGLLAAVLFIALNGFFVAAGLTHCAAVRQIVVTTHAFPYDFGGPAGPCP